MMQSLPFFKAEAVGNDFLIMEWAELERRGSRGEDLPTLAKTACDRRLGVGADGLEVVYPSREAGARIRLFNSDGGEAEISGNGTRCVAAFLVAERAAPDVLTIETMAGTKRLELLERRDSATFVFDMAMGAPRYRGEEIGCGIELTSGSVTATLLDVGNPQCAVFADDLDSLDWRALGRELEAHPRFPNRTNVSFIKVVDQHTVDVRFWERGAGETLSSGTGSSGAAAAAILAAAVCSPVRVLTPAGEMLVRWDGGELFLRGPARLIARGEFIVSR